MPFRSVWQESSGDISAQAGDMLENVRTGEETMEDANQAGAAILVQTIFLKDGRLQGMLGERASNSPEAAVNFLKPFYLAALAMMAGAKTEQAG